MVKYMCVCYIIIATWGHPAYWYDANYRFNERTYSSCCTLIPILSYLVENNGMSSIKRIYILGLDSIADSVVSSITCSDKPRQVTTTSGGKQSKCSVVFNKCVEEISKCISCCGTYLDLVNLNESIYKCVFNELISTDPVLKSRYSCILEKSRFIILPATGKPGGNLLFRGDPENYSSIALIDIGTDLLRITDLSECETISIWFDSSHGINYMPVLTLRISEIIAQILRVRFKSRIEIKVYNSDPYPRGRPSGEIVLNINKIHSKKVIEVEIPRIYSGKWHNVYSEKDFHISDNKPQSIGEKIGKEMDRLVTSNLKRSVLSILSSLYSPAPLALMYACHEFLCNYCNKLLSNSDYKLLYCRETYGELVGEQRRDALDCLLEVKKKWIELVEVDPNSNTYTRFLTLLSNTVWTILLAYATCQYIYEELVKDRDNIELFENIIGLKYDFLRKIFMDTENSIYARIHSTHFYIINDEFSRLVNKLKEVSREKLFNKCIIYDELISGLHVQQIDSSSKIREPVERILIAHAGLQSDLVEICGKNNNVYIKYLNLKIVRKIFDHLTNVLSKQ